MSGQAMTHAEALRRSVEAADCGSLRLARYWLQVASELRVQRDHGVDAQPARTDCGALTVASLAWLSGSPAVLGHDDFEVRVSVSALCAEWRALTGDPAPMLATVARELAAVSIDAGPVQRRIRGVPTRFYRIPVATLQEVKP